MKKMALGFAMAVLLAHGSPAAQHEGPVIDVVKTPTCGCCAAWVEHLKAAGFATRVTNMDDLTALKDAQGVPQAARSCHTARVGGYVIEGHVPASDIRRLLRERPGVVGVAVPGMPVGSPGMEVPNVRPRAYRSFTFDKQGQLTLFSAHNE